jgi:hypothetical protein
MKRYKFGSYVHRKSLRDSAVRALIMAEQLGKPLIVCELGVRRGDNAKVLLDHLPIEKLYLVDRKNMPEGEFSQYKEKCKFYVKSSKDVTDEDIPPECLDYLYIDADHRYESIKFDIKHWWHRVKPGGLIGGHDFHLVEDHPEPFGVTQAVEEFAKENGLKYYSVLPAYCEESTGNSDWWV